jgi:iron complex outermembrane receptor protein
VRQYETQLDGIEYLSLLANATNGVPIPRWRSTLTLDWTRGAWGATLGQSYASGYVERVQFGSSDVRNVDAASAWDVQGRYTGLPGWQLAAGIRNLFDEDPPFSLTSFFQFGFNPQVGSPLGRTFYLRAGYRFE